MYNQAVPSLESPFPSARIADVHAGAPHDSLGIQVNCSALAERLRAECRTCAVIDTGAGLIITDTRIPYLKVYVRDDGLVRSRWEYPAPDRRGRIRGLREDDVDAIMTMGRMFALPSFMLDGSTERQAMRLRLHLGRQAMRLAPHQIHTGIRITRLMNVADERYAVWRAYQHLIQDAIDDGDVEQAFSGMLRRDMQTLVDAIASRAGLNLITALIIDETARTQTERSAGARSPFDRYPGYAVEHVDYDGATCAGQLTGLLHTAVERVGVAGKPDPTRIRAMRTLLTTIVNRLPDSALRSSGITRLMYGHVLILISWWLGEDLIRLSDAALRLELATQMRNDDLSGGFVKSLDMSDGTSICTRVVRNGMPGWRHAQPKHAQPKRPNTSGRVA